MARKLTINPTIPIEIQRSLKQLNQWAQEDQGHITKLQAQNTTTAPAPPAATQAQSVTSSLLSSKISTLVNFRGTWSKSIAYVNNDLVLSSGSAYLNLKPCTGVPVTNTAYWFHF